MIAHLLARSAANSMRNRLPRAVVVERASRTGMLRVTIDLWHARVPIGLRHQHPPGPRGGMAEAD